MIEGNEMDFDYKEGGEDEKIELIKQTTSD